MVDWRSEKTRMETDRALLLAGVPAASDIQPGIGTGRSVPGGYRQPDRGNHGGRRVLRDMGYGSRAFAQLCGYLRSGGAVSQDLCAEPHGSGRIPVFHGEQGGRLLRGSQQDSVCLLIGQLWKYRKNHVLSGSVPVFVDPSADYPGNCQIL